MSEVQKLAEVIRGKGIALGDTPVGQEFCLKALHPSDSAATCHGVPDGGSLPTFVHNYQYVSTFGLPSGGDTTKTYTGDLVLYPHPRHMGYVQTREGTHMQQTFFLNGQCPTDVDFPK